MKKILGSLSFLGNIVLLSYIFSSGYKKVHIRRTASPEVTIKARYVDKNPIHEGVKEIAILTPATHPSLEKIQKGFIEHLASEPKILCKYTVFNANGNRTLMRAQIEEIIQRKYDLLYCIGAHATQMAKEVTTRKQAWIPTVFGAVSNPAGLGLVSQEVFSGNHLTGSAATTNYAKQIDLLIKLKPAVKKVLIIYDPSQSSGLENDKNEVIGLLSMRGIHSTVVEVYKTREVFEKVPTLLSGQDVVFIFKDNTVVPAIDGLVKLCTRYGITLFASDLDSVEKGAVLGFGVSEDAFGINAAECALEILLEHKKPAQVPIRLTNNFKLKINTKAMQSQNIMINEEVLALMQVVEIV